MAKFLISLVVALVAANSSTAWGSIICGLPAMHRGDCVAAVPDHPSNSSDPLEDKETRRFDDRCHTGSQPITSSSGGASVVGLACGALRLIIESPPIEQVAGNGALIVPPSPVSTLMRPPRA